MPGRRGLARVVGERVDRERVHHGLRARARLVGRPHVEDELRRRMRVPRERVVVGAARGERAAEDDDVRRHRLQRVVGLGEEREVRGRGDVLAVRPELREPEAVQVRLVADRVVAHGGERLRERGDELRELRARLLGQRRRPAARMRDDEEDLHLVRGRREHRVLERREVAAGRLDLVGEPVLGHPDRGEAGRLRPEHLGLRKRRVALLGHVGRRPDDHRRSTRERGRRQCERCDPCDDPFEHPGTHDGHGYASHQK